MERKEMSRERTPKGGLYATQISISFNYWFWSAKQRGEEEMSSERETPKRVTQITQNPYLSQLLPSILPIDRLDGCQNPWVSRYKKKVKNLVFHESILSYAADLLKVELDTFLLKLHKVISVPQTSGVWGTEIIHKGNRTQIDNIRNNFLRMPAAVRKVQYQENDNYSN
jgi:hypothetical protein